MNGLVLEGGGAKGAFQIGAWKAIRELNIPIDGIAGTSVGALNGAIIAQDEFEKCYDIWYNMSPSKIMNVDDSILEKLLKFEINNENFHYIIVQMKKVLEGGGLDITPLKDLLASYIDEDKIRNSKKDFGIITVSLTDRRAIEVFLEDIPMGELINYLLASAYLPVFKTEKLGGKHYFDGGIYDNLPIRPLLRRGYDNIIAVRLFGLGRIRRVRDNSRITYITPSEGLGMTLDFTNERARKNLELGYYDTMRVFQELKGSKYYIKGVGDEDYFFNYFMNLNNMSIKRLANILDIQGVPSRRLLLEVILPRVSELMDIDASENYEDIVLRLYERLAKKQKLERFKIYNYDDLKDSIYDDFGKMRIVRTDKIPSIIKKNDLLVKAVKDELLDEVAGVVIGSNLKY